MKIYISQSNDIYFNLALENWLFLQKLEDRKILFLWQNSPSVVVGRAQNPWAECNLKAMINDDVPLVRRQSGGGTVYHDYGNLNYTIISPKKEHDIKANLEFISKIIQKLGIEIYPNERNDIVANHNKEIYKVSGSAFREKKDRAFHHGTMLINTDTDKLYNYLHQPIDSSLETKGVKSHRSKVINLSEIKVDIQIQDVINSFINNFERADLNFINEETTLENQQLIKDEIKVLKSWQWCFGKTLPFTKIYKKDEKQIKIIVNSGFVSELEHNRKQIDISNKKLKFKEELNFNKLTEYL